MFDECELELEKAIAHATRYTLLSISNRGEKLFKVRQYCIYYLVLVAVLFFYTRFNVRGDFFRGHTNLEQVQTLRFERCFEPQYYKREVFVSNQKLLCKKNTFETDACTHMFISTALSI